MVKKLVLLSFLFSSCGGTGSDPAIDAGVGDYPGDQAPETFQTVGPYECLVDPDCRQVMVASHRGYHRFFPENSLAAIRGAAEVGAHFAEIDVRHTKDDELVLMHNDTVDATTDGTGKVEDLTLAQVRALNLTGGDPGVPESTFVPLFEEALALARDLGIMLYVDHKTWRYDLTLAVVKEGDFHDVALIRDGLDTVEKMVEEDKDLLVMPPVDFELHFLTALELIPELMVVEIPGGAANPELTQAIVAHGVKVQQDALGPTDILGAFGDYSAWKDMIEAGIWLPQTDYPDVLAPVVMEYNQTGTFPSSGPGRLE